MFNWFNRKQKEVVNRLFTDMHSHLLPGIDDGARTIDDSIHLIKQLKDLGYSRFITTPHVMSAAYRNTPETILAKLDTLRSRIAAESLDITIDAAAEYYLDEELMQSLSTDQKILTFGDNYLLFETNFLTEPLTLKEFIFQASVKGYKPILAHPERYQYLEGNFSKLEDLLNRGVTFQLNISSITGYYSRAAQKMAHELIDRKWVHWLGTDCHHDNHIHVIAKARASKYYQKALSLPLLNYTLS